MKVAVALICAALNFAPPASTAAEDSATPAPAQAGRDEVVLKNGGFVRGTVTGLEPDVSVTIIDATGNARTFEWAEVDQVERNKYAAEATPPTAAATEPDRTSAPNVPPNPAPSVEPNGTRIRLIDSRGSGRSMDLHRVEGELQLVTSSGSGTGVAHKKVCTAPCDRTIEVDPGDEFFVHSNFTTASKRFQVGTNGEYEVDVRPGIKGLWMVGALMASAGAGMVVGAVASDDPTARGAFIAGAVAGAGASVPLFVFSRHRVRSVQRR